MEEGRDSLMFERSAHPAPTPADTRRERLRDPGFGRVFTDHMVEIDYREGEGWGPGRVVPRGPLLLDPATAVLHYAQEIFEGLKAYRTADGGTVLFRPDANAARFRASAERLAMPALPEATFVDAITALVDIDRDWIPDAPGGALYLRPFMFASEVFLGVRPAREYKFLVIASSVGAYFKSDAPAITIGVARDHTRAAPGGTGAAKCGGNYAASLAPQAAAIAQGCDQLVFLDAVERRFVEELGGMNLFFVFDDGSLVTPPLDGTILAGITRDSLIRLARDEGLHVREERYAIEQWRDDALSGRLIEAFACGTAAVVTSVGQVRDGEFGFTIGSGAPGQLTERLRRRLVAIQRAEVPDPYGWVQRLF